MGGQSGSHLVTVTSTVAFGDTLGAADPILFRLSDSGTAIPLPGSGHVWNSDALLKPVSDGVAPYNYARTQ